jgi:general secretion pathway protein M
MEQLKTLIADVQNWYARLSTRERKLVLLAGGAASAFLLFIVLMSFASQASSYRKRTAEKTIKLQTVMELSASFREAERVRQSVERQLSSSDIRLITFLEEKGTQAGLDIPTMNPKGDLPLGDSKIVESSVELTLTDITLQKLLSFLSTLESGPGVVKVKFLRIEPRTATGTLTAWATISTYRLKP